MKEEGTQPGHPDCEIEDNFGADHPDHPGQLGEEQPDVTDVPLTPEELEEEEFRLMVLQAQQEALEEERAERHAPAKRRKVPRAAIWVMALVLLFQPIAFLFDIYSLPAIDFLKTSARLSKQPDIAEWKQSVAVILTEDGKGTGFVVSGDGKVITNHHVVQNRKQITVSFDKNGRYAADIIAEDNVNDLAVLQMKDPPDVPPLPLAKSPDYSPGEAVRFIGNPLNFYGIANEGELIGETRWAGRTTPVILLAAPVYRGNSGSPVFQDKEVIGVIFAVTDLDKYGKAGMFIRIEEVLYLLGTTK
ncbi:S1 family peptidase [Sporosarcina trichiuri]|uniref:S1 family peptidase n=1 Tax=Sporosarcina trichiuri TaxID=3056445 RepID=UPI0025B51821|nr:serine protease [Sporosarcina sp. 0.2-SM1T-5]WJY28394.1 serine protease [Sporosarcina sp. 0.2-SM1T-5]